MEMNIDFYRKYYWFYIKQYHDHVANNNIAVVFCSQDQQEERDNSELQALVPQIMYQIYIRKLVEVLFKLLIVIKKNKKSHQRHQQFLQKQRKNSIMRLDNKLESSQSYFELYNE
ncbi:hypothetical protein TTHERM_000997551 (macronuclear) [Tetrahymena thermophila SB210]|uniref:Uncharacterized protein n=1 Tax=Tetrahymena thermophila (strain SB210) TaxID=312017 RepID=W7X2S1_TETTS|nr:hypothetical protein TTHERM_000997551 [Tetrahymena thermophila SB210]EWS73590.1 hypothetical protein TTHERM_000997551 [Tetrahymena thermophila SB210]|eukprot:XP_012653872.1 hypothetical protein TTHERM_000997551 [Tetrahymena thermophila SB210]